MSLKWYILKRILQAIPLVFATIILTFFIIHLAPGDPIYLLIGEASVDPEFIQRMRVEYGLDKPLYEQLSIYLMKFLRGDLGESVVYGQSVVGLIMERIPATLLLMLTSIIVGTGIGILLGVYSSRKPHSLTDYFLTSISVVGYSIPRFWLALMLLLVFGLWLNLFPISGMTSLAYGYTGIQNVADVLWHLILPVSALSIRYITLVARLTRSNMLEALSQDYIITAKSKGLDERSILYKHALRNALLPVITVVGMNFGFMFSGSVLIESIFGWPGMGSLLYHSFYARDYPVIMGMFVLVSVIVIIASLIADISYAFVDPRIKYE